MQQNYLFCLSPKGSPRETARTQRYHVCKNALLYLFYTKAVGRLTGNAVCPLHFIKRFSAQQMLPLIYQIERLPASEVQRYTPLCEFSGSPLRKFSGCPLRKFSGSPLWKCSSAGTYAFAL